MFGWQRVRGFEHRLDVDHLFEKHEPRVEELAGAFGQLGTFQTLGRSNTITTRQRPKENSEEGGREKKRGYVKEERARKAERKRE